MRKCNEERFEIYFGFLRQTGCIGWCWSGIMLGVSPNKVKVMAPYPFVNGTAVELNKTLKQG